MACQVGQVLELLQSGIEDSARWHAEADQPAHAEPPPISGASVAPGVHADITTVYHAVFVESAIVFPSPVGPTLPSSDVAIASHSSSGDRPAVVWKKKELR